MDIKKKYKIMNDNLILVVIMRLYRYVKVKTRQYIMNNWIFWYKIYKSLSIYQLFFKKEKSHIL